MMITAPNSLMPRAHIIIIPEIMPRVASGRVILKNERKGPSPHARAICSRGAATERNASTAEL